jgi:hypothetical protein
MSTEGQLKPENQEKETAVHRREVVHKFWHKEAGFIKKRKNIKIK